MNIDIDNHPHTVELFGGNKQRATVFLDRYARKGADGQPTETSPQMMAGRVAAAIARQTEYGHPDVTEYNEYFDLLRDFKFVPGGRILAGAGTETQVTYYNCYVIPVETEHARGVREGMRETGEPEENFEPDPHGADSRRAIFDTIGRMVDIMSRGGGVGINWSVLRPSGAYLKTVNGTSSGPVGWMNVASTAVGEVEQGGSRRGAAMFMLDDWHPDVLNFINAKRNLDRITNANVSVAVSDRFMEAVRLDEHWTTMFPDTTHEKYDSEWDGDIGRWIRNGYPTKTYETFRARDIWRALAQAAWDNGEPGVVFLDRYNQQSTGKGVERIISVNPCGEQGLGPYSVCNLGAMNLDAYIVRGDEEWQTEFDWATFEKDVRTAVRFLDSVIDSNFYFIPENEAVQKDLRRIGLGVMGLADALIGLGLRYGSNEAVAFTNRVFETMRYMALMASWHLAKEHGPAPAWKPEMADRPYIKWLAEGYDSTLWEDIKRDGLRNIFLLTQAPTGTTSILAGVNSGIEPYFAFGYWRNDRTGKHWVPAPASTKYGVENETADFWVTANEVTVEEHIAMQAAAQAHIDSSVSKTINAPNSHTVEDVERAYTLAYDSGLKGLAYFRDGCGRAQVLTREEPTKVNVHELPEVKERIDSLNRLIATVGVRQKRPTTLKGETRKVMHAGGSAYVTLNRDADGKPFEVFVLTGKAGSDVMMLGEALGRLASLALQHGADPYELAEELTGIGGHRKFGATMPHAIGTAIQTMLDEEVVFVGTAEEFIATLDEASDLQANGIVTQDTEATGQLCPECDSFSVVLEEGCSKCHVCGWSAC